MKLVEAPPRFVFFTGKGGVGKTSIACATAIALADAGKRVLLVSTDPASNVGQVFDLAIGNHITPIGAVANLSALEIDPQAAAAAYRERIVGPVRNLLPAAVVSGIEEQLSGACTTEVAAFDEFTALLTDDTLTAGFDHVIFDTAPTGHTIRLLQLPGAWSGFLEAGKGDASCLGPLAGLDKHKTQYKAALAALADTTRTRLVLVARAQAGALRELARTHGELAGVGISEQYLVINGLLPATEASKDALAEAIHVREQAALAALPSVLARLPRDELPLLPFDMVGVGALRALFKPVVPGADVVDASITGAEGVWQASRLSSLVDDIARDGHGLVMLMGKGGVGKTTLAASIALELARRGLPVHLSTSDPAAHLEQTLDSTLPQLTVSRIDPQVETARYREQVMASKGAELDAAGRALLAEDLRSPCTEEIAVFQAFARVIAEARTRFVVMDTAPTGHTLLLLDATGAYHREIARQQRDGAALALTPMSQLRDPAQTKVLLVTLAETTPVLEAAHLQDDLRRAGIEPWAWIVNNSIAASQPASPLLKRRAANEMAVIERVASTHARRLAVVPVLRDEPVGAERLHALASAA
ncbi:MAG: arsenical pump-driving ATPase [Proteobacteria bacterium]|nr:arsenical pump-driving ATPase [Pseudomonadota bacterium]